MHDLFLQRWEGDVKFPREVVTDQALAGFDRGIFMRYMPGKMNPENRRARDESVFGAHEDYTIPVEYAWTSEHNQRLRTRWDFIERHKKNLKRFYGWLEQTGTGDRLAKMMGTETAQERQDRRQREQAETRDAEQAQLAEQEKRHHLWSPEHFDQFTIVDNYTWKDEPFTHHANKSEINAAYRLAHNLLDTSDFAKIENTQRLLNDLRNEAERSQRDTVEQFDLSAPITTKVSKFLVQQNFQEKVHYEQLEKVNDNEETRK